MTSQDINRAIRSNYGKRDAQITSQGPTQARAFSRTIDHAAVETVSNEIAEMKREVREKEQPHQKLRGKIDKGREMRSTLAMNVKTLDEEYQELKKRASRFQRAKYELETAQGRLETLEAQPSSEQQRAALRAEKLAKATKLVAPVAAWSKVEDEEFASLDQFVKHRLDGIHADVNLAAVTEKLRSGEDDVNNAKRRLEESECFRCEALQTSC